VWRFRVIIAIDTIHDPNCVGNIGTINWFDPCIDKMTTLTTLSISFYFVWRFRVIIAIDTIHDPNCVGNIGTKWFDPCIDKMTTLTTLSISFISCGASELSLQSTPYMTPTVLAISAPRTGLILVLTK
jgi:hypothetical protein